MIRRRLDLTLPQNPTSDQLDILALEPFYGGARKIMLETLIHHSRHRWTLLKLPPRRMERRLTAAANWFAEQLSRHWVGRVDLLFTSEALNLADLVRLLPEVAQKPSVVYFHDNQLPDPPPVRINAKDVVNMATAQAATELWFNTSYHLDNFARRASALISRHPELSTRDPMPEILQKTRLMPPPIDLSVSGDISPFKQLQRRKQLIFVETRDTDMRLLNDGLHLLRDRGENFDLVTVGPVKELSSDFARTPLPEWDDYAHTAAMFQTDVFLSARRAAAVDHYAVRAVMARCWPVVPADGFYPEIIPENLQERCLYDGTPDGLANCIQDAWYLQMPEAANESLLASLKRYDAIANCRAMDDRLSEVAVSYGMAHESMEE
ncbi:MAG: DUF3524 domain-containing protein [Tepidisphaeraceae bacterium]|jgi:hypothetical protein